MVQLGTLLPLAPKSSLFKPQMYLPATTSPGPCPSAARLPRRTAPRRAATTPTWPGSALKAGVDTSCYPSWASSPPSQQPGMGLGTCKPSSGGRIPCGSHARGFSVHSRFEPQSLSCLKKGFFSVVNLKTLIYIIYI